MASVDINFRRFRQGAPGWAQGGVVVALTATLLALLGFGLIRTRLPLVVEVDGVPFQVRTHAATVGAALEHAGLDLYPEDLVWPDLEAALSPGAMIRIQRARPVVLSADGRAHRMRTHAATIGEFLADAKIKVGPADELWLNGQLVDLETPLDSSLPSVQQHWGGSLYRQEISQPTNPPILQIRRAATLTLDDGGAATILHTTSDTVAQVLQEHGVTLFVGDIVHPGLQEPVTQGMALQIQRSVPVQIEADGRLIRTRTLAEKVAGALGQEGIALVGRDRVKPHMAAPVRPGMTIELTRVREDLEVEFEPIPFETVWVGDPEVEIDNIRLVQDGRIGLTKRRYRVVYEDDQEVARRLEDVWAAEAPITKTMAYGTKIVVRTLDTPEGPVEYWRKMRVYTTSYTAASAGKPKTHPRYGYTRLGWWLTKGVVAVDPEVIPLRTKIYVPGYGIGRAGDTGGGVKGKFVDLGFDADNYESWHWWTDIYILTPVPPRNDIRWVLPNWPRYPDRGR